MLQALITTPGRNEQMNNILNATIPRSQAMAGGYVHVFETSGKCFCRHMLHREVAKAYEEAYAI